MNARWAVQLASQQEPMAAALRSFPGVEVCLHAGSLWLRGPRDGGPIERAMWLLPGLRYDLAADGKLTPWNHLLPASHCPEGPWQSLAGFVRPDISAPTLPGQCAQRVTLSLVRSTIERPAALLLLDAPTWQAYINTAPSVRLKRLHFALSEEGFVLVRGKPLPSLPGTPFTLDAGIALPCGYVWSPAVSASVVAESLALAGDDMALYAPDGTCQILPEAAWVPVSRSAVRISLEGV